MAETKADVLIRFPNSLDRTDSHSHSALLVTEKHTTTVLRQKQFWVGLSDMQGWRISEHLPVPSS